MPPCISLRFQGLLGRNGGVIIGSRTVSTTLRKHFVPFRLLYGCKVSPYLHAFIVTEMDPVEHFEWHKRCSEHGQSMHPAEKLFRKGRRGVSKATAGTGVAQESCRAVRLKAFPAVSGLDPG